MNEKMYKIKFEKPDLKEITKKYTAVDMHIHTKYSDGLNKIDSIVKKAKRLNIGIAITDHNDIRAAVELQDYDIFNIPGIEITSREGSHLLAYFDDIKKLKKFYLKEIKPNLNKNVMARLKIGMEEIIIKAKKYDGLIIFAHPYSLFYTGVFNCHFNKKQINKMLEMVDGVEAINSENLHKWNMKCALLGLNLNKSITGGSDGHNIGSIGKTITYGKCKKNPADFIKMIKKKKNYVLGKEVNVLKKVTSNGFRMKRIIRDYPDILTKNITYSYKALNVHTKPIKDGIKGIGYNISMKIKKDKN